MATIFKYNNKVYQAVNLDKKLKRLKISRDDIEILLETTQSELEKEYLRYSNLIKETPTEHNPKLYEFTDGKNTIVSVYDNLDHLKNVIDITNYEPL